MRRKVLSLLLLWLSLLAQPAWSQSTHVEPRTASNLLICSWNVKWFKDSGRDLTKLAKVIAKFDLCGIVELQSDTVMEGLAAALEAETGERWTYIQSNRTGHAKYIEQFAFIWRDGEVRIASGPVGNVEDFADIFRHEPYIASFRAGNFDFRFLLIHTRWTTEADREREVEQIAHEFVFFRGLTGEKDLVLGGDFNYSHGSSKMDPVKDLDQVINLIPTATKTTLKSSGEGFSSWYDHIYVHAGATQERTGKAGAYDFVAGLGYARTQTARKEISDHLPVWAEFRIDGPDDD